MSDCKQIDALMMDWLYDELGSSDKARFDAHVDACARCQSEIDAFARTREAVRALPEEDPPPALSAILLHEAAKRAPAAGGRAPGMWAWFLGLFQPIVAHPAAAAVATLVLVAGVAGSLYLRGERVETASPGAISDRGVAAGDRAPAAAWLAEARASEDLPSAVATPDETRGPDGEAAAAHEPGYRVGALDEQQKQGYLAFEATAEPGLQQLEPDEAGRALARREVAQPEGESARVNRSPSRPMSTRGRTVAKAVSSADLLDEAELEGFAQGVTADGVPEQARGVEARGDAAGRSDGKVSGVARQRVLGGVESDRSPEGVKRARKPEPPPPPADVGAGSVASGDSRDKAPLQSRDSRRASTASPDTAGGASLAWARATERQMLQAIRRKDCRSAARLAADIFDRERGYYSRNIENARGFRSCVAEFAAEQRQRARRRARKAGSAPEQSAAEPISQ